MKFAKKKLNLHRDWIDSRAVDIIRKLQEDQHTAYLVGGCIRDLLLEIQPKDFDIATTAEPTQVKRCVPKAYIIGKRFRLVLAKRGEDLFEIATFRKNINKGHVRPHTMGEVKSLTDEDELNPTADQKINPEMLSGGDNTDSPLVQSNKPSASPLQQISPPASSITTENTEENFDEEMTFDDEALVDQENTEETNAFKQIGDEVDWGDNEYGTPEEDAQRRDFTINGLFYDPVSENLIDFTNGLRDLRLRIVRMIGEPVERLVEDPIRILRAIRLSHKVGFTIEPGLRKAMFETAHTLPLSALPRRREEFLKLLRLDRPCLAFLESFDLNVIEHTCPTLFEELQDREKQDRFFHILSQMPNFEIDKDNNIELFSVLALAFFRITVDANPKEFVKDYKDHHKLRLFMRHELGMFNYEQEVFLRALQLYPSFYRIEEMNRKGDRKQLAMAKNEAFPLALKLARGEGALSDSQWSFWAELYETQLPKLLESDTIQSQQVRKKIRSKKRPRPYKKAP